MQTQDEDIIAIGTIRTVSIRTVTSALVLAAALTGCSSTDTGAGTDPLDTATSTPVPSEQSQIYSAALHHLILVDNPFAKAPTPVGYIYIVDGPASRSSEMSIAADGPQFDTDLKNEITARAADLPPVEFVADPQLHTEPARQGLTGVDNDGVLVGLSPLGRQDDGTVHVGAGLWCGRDCGLGLTYVLDHVDGRWTVTGTTGPVVIS
ncbi:hypothetical protein NJ76_18125 [Rhodococcus sp. IITR03]|nr:hypothetical protein NJ76_18125 [Rhodococcus sp. IITR03]